MMWLIDTAGGAHNWAHVSRIYPSADNLPMFLYSVWVTCRIGGHHFFGHLPESAVFPVRSAAEEATT